MKLYIAHNFGARVELARTICPYLKARGHEITSRWITEASFSQVDGAGARADLDDLDAADALLFFADQCGNSPGRGKFVELGYAIAKGKPVFSIGQDDGCIFLHLPQIMRIACISQLGTLGEPHES